MLSVHFFEGLFWGPIWLLPFFFHHRHLRDLGALFSVGAGCNIFTGLFLRNVCPCSVSRDECRDRGLLVGGVKYLPEGITKLLPCWVAQLKNPRRYGGRSLLGQGSHIFISESPWCVNSQMKIGLQDLRAEGRLDPSMSLGGESFQTPGVVLDSGWVKGRLALTTVGLWPCVLLSFWVCWQGCNHLF